MKKVEAKFTFRPDLDLAEHQHYAERLLKDSIEAYENSLGYPPRAWRWPNLAEIRATANTEPDPMVEINKMRRGLNPDPFRRYRQNRRIPRAK